MGFPFVFTDRLVTLDPKCDQIPEAAVRIRPYYQHHRPRPYSPQGGQPIIAANSEAKRWASPGHRADK
jgi:hypothetical protein